MGNISQYRSRRRVAHAIISVRRRNPLNTDSLVSPASGMLKLRDEQFAREELHENRRLCSSPIADSITDGNRLPTGVEIAATGRA
jgi:hypothetical protein